MDKSKTIEGIILSRKDIGEADRLVTVYSKSEGKISVIARGARRLRSKNACHIEPFTVGKYSIVQGKTFYILTGAESSCTNSAIGEDLTKYQAATYLCELLNIVGQENIKMPDTYRVFTETIGRISEGKVGNIDVRICEYVLLKEMGYGGSYRSCCVCGDSLIEQDKYSGGFEGIECNNCAHSKPTIEKVTLKILRLLENGEFDKIRNIKNIEEQNQKLKSIINIYLYTVLPKTPKTGDL